MNQKKSDKPWFIYLIKNKFNHLYAGVTVDLTRRFYEHASNSPKCAKALKGKTPLELVFCAQLLNQSEALKLEMWLKKQTRRTKDQLIVGTLQLPVENTPLNAKHINDTVMQKLADDAKLKKVSVPA